MFIYKTRDIKNLNDFLDAVKVHNSKIQYVVKFAPDQLRFTLSESLTEQEDDALESFIGAFDDSYIESPLRILSLVKEEAAHKHFHNIDYIKEIKSGMSLIPERESGTVQGEVREVVWYAGVNENLEPHTPVIKENATYTRAESGLPYWRVKERVWYREDGTIHPEKKITVKFYVVNKQDMIDEGIKRRSLLVKSIQIPVMEMMGEVLTPLNVTEAAILIKGRHFMDQFEHEFNKFIDNSSTIADPADPNYGRKSVIVALENVDALEHSWIDMAPNSLGGATTIRQYLINEFDI